MLAAFPGGRQGDALVCERSEFGYIESAAASYTQADSRANKPANRRTSFTAVRADALGKRASARHTPRRPDSISSAATAKAILRPRRDPRRGVDS